MHKNHTINRSPRSSKQDGGEVDWHISVPLQHGLQLAPFDIRPACGGVWFWLPRKAATGSWITLMVGNPPGRRTYREPAESAKDGERLGSTNHCHFRGLDCGWFFVVDCSFWNIFDIWCYLPQLDRFVGQPWKVGWLGCISRKQMSFLLLITGRSSWK